MAEKELHGAKVPGLAINLGSLSTPHRVRAIKGRIQADASNRDAPAAHIAGWICEDLHVADLGRDIGSRWPGVLAANFNGISRLLRDLKLNWSICLLLDDCCSMPHIGSQANVV
jgi:hypothetical protein